MDEAKKRTLSEPELDTKRSKLPFSIAIYPSEPVVPLNVAKKQNVLLAVTPKNEPPSSRTYRIIIVADDSASMQGEKAHMVNKMINDVLKNGINKSVLFEHTHIGVVVFGSDVEEELCHNLSPLKTAGTWVAQLQGESGQTNIFAGVSRAVQMLDDCAAPDDTQDHIVLLTDGNANLGEYQTGTQIRSNCIGDRLIGLHCIALGDQPERLFVETLVDDGKFGLFAFANTPSGLPNAYETVFMGICNSRGLMDVKFMESGLSSATFSQRVGILMNDTFYTELSHSTLSMAAPQKMLTNVELKVNNRIVANTAFCVEAVSCPPSEQPVDPSYKSFLKERELKNNILQAINQAPTLRAGREATQRVYNAAVASNEFDTRALQRMNAMIHSVEQSVVQEESSGQEFSYRSLALLRSQMSSQRY